MCLLQSCEEGIAKLRTASSNPGTPIYYTVNQILYPLVQGCESKDIKIIKVSKTVLYIFNRKKNRISYRMLYKFL